MLARMVFVLTFSDLLLNFFSHQIDGRIQVAFHVLGEQIRAGQRQADRTGELALRRFGLIALEGDPNIHRKPRQMIEFVDLIQDVVLNCLGQRHVVRRKN